MDSGLFLITILSMMMQKRAVVVKGETNWNPVRQGDLGCLMVLYKPQQNNDTQLQATLGQACGGVLVYNNKVLTQCACMRSFFHAHDDIPPNFDKVPPGPGSPQDIMSEDIYVTYWPAEDSEFIADQKHVLHRNPVNFMKKSKCYNDIKAVAEGKKDVGLLQASTVVVMFSPVISLSLILSPATIIPWSEVDQSIEPYIFAYGMSKKNPAEEIVHPISGKAFDPSTHVVEYEFDFLNKTCPYTEYCKMQIFNDTIPTAYNQTVKCLCMKQQSTIQICQGVPGFPLTNGDDTAGVMASPIDCDSGSVMIYTFDQEAVQEIEAFKNQDLVKVSTTASDASVMTILSTTEGSNNTATTESRIPVFPFTVPSPELDSANLLTASNTFVIQIMFFIYTYCEYT